MPVNSTVSKRTYIARESVSGTRQPPNLFLEGLNLKVMPNSTRGEVRPSGSTMRTARPKVQDWSTFSIADGSYLDFNSALYWLSAMLGMPTTTTPGGGTISREHAFTYAADGLNTRPTFTFATGYRGGSAEEAVRNVFQSINFGFSRTAAPTIGGSGFGRNLDLDATLGVSEVNVLTIDATDGTFTVAVDGGSSTSAVAENATAGTLQTAVEALSNVAAGGVDVVITGSAGGPYTFTWQPDGAFGNTDVVLTADGTSLTGGGHSATVTTTQAGGITTIPVKAVQAPELDVWLDDVVGDIGTTKIRPYSGEFTFSGLVNPDWVIDSDLESYDEEVLQVPDLTLNMVLRNDATARALYADLLDGATYYMRVRALGPVIEGSIPYELRMDCAVVADENIGQFGDEGGAETMPFPLTIVSDSTFASGGFSALLRNTLTGL